MRMIISLLFLLVALVGCAPKQHVFGSPVPTPTPRTHDSIVTSDTTTLCWASEHFAAMTEQGLPCPEQAEVEPVVEKSAEILGRELKDLEYPILVFTRAEYGCGGTDDAWGCRTCNDSNFLTIYYNPDWKNTVTHELFHAWLWTTPDKEDSKFKCDVAHEHKDWPAKVYPAFRSWWSGRPSE